MKDPKIKNQKRKKAKNFLNNNHKAISQKLKQAEAH